MKVTETPTWSYTMIETYKGIKVKKWLEIIMVAFTLLDDVIKIDTTQGPDKTISISSLSYLNNTFKNILRELLEIIRKAPKEHYFLFPFERKWYMLKKIYAGDQYALLQIYEGSPGIIEGVFATIDILCDNYIQSISITLPHEKDEIIPILLTTYLETNNRKNTAVCQILKQALET